MKRRIGSVIVTLALIVAACDSIGRPGGAPALLPDVPNTDRIEGTTITDYISTLGEGKALLAGNPILAGGIALAEKVVDCYQQIGAVAVRVYVDKTSPLSTGLVAIIDRAALTDPGNFIRCPSGGDQQFSAQAALSICANRYTLKKDDTE